MRKKWLALALACLMGVAPCLGMAESAPAFDAEAVRPLLDAVTAAALGGEETVGHLSEEEALTGVFLARLTAALTDNGLDAAALAALVAMPTDGAGEAADEAVTPMTLRVLYADVSEDGDAAMLLGEAEELHLRVAVELRKDEESPVGWKLCRFTAEDLALIEALTDSYFAGTLIEYVNTGCGFSIQYPAVFGESQAQETDSGLQAELADGSASFSAMRADNPEGLTLEALLAREKECGATVWTDEGTGAGRSVITDEDGITHQAIFLIGDGAIYQAELNYREELADEYEGYAEYMTNSFCVDELGLG